MDLCIEVVFVVVVFFFFSEIAMGVVLMSAILVSLSGVDTPIV